MIKVLMYSTRQYDKDSFEMLRRKNRFKIHLDNIDKQLREGTEILSVGYDGVIVFVNDLIVDSFLDCRRSIGFGRNLRPYHYHFYCYYRS